jgi:phosphonate transport system ATP-binding protein
MPQTVYHDFQARPDRAPPPGGTRARAARDSTWWSPGRAAGADRPSGAGKTTLLATLACAHQPASGSFEAFGVDPWALGDSARHALRARLFLAPQTPPLPPRQRVVTAVLAARLPHWSLWRALASLFKPRPIRKPPSRRCPASAWATSCIAASTACPAANASAAAWRACCCRRPGLPGRRAAVRARPGPVPLTLATLQQEAAARKATLVCSLHQVEWRAPFPAHRRPARRPHRVRPAARAGQRRHDRRALPGRTAARQLGARQRPAGQAGRRRLL